MIKRGVGLVCAHYAVEVPKEKGGPEFERWIGGYYETFWSVNPPWMMTKPILAKDHPITRGVKPFAIKDEWYYNMRFPAGHGRSDGYLKRRSPGQHTGGKG